MAESLSRSGLLALAVTASLGASACGGSSRHHHESKAVQRPQPAKAVSYLPEFHRLAASIINRGDEDPSHTFIEPKPRYMAGVSVPILGGGKLTMEVQTPPTSKLKPNRAEWVRIIQSGVGTRNYELDFFTLTNGRINAYCYDNAGSESELRQQVTYLGDKTQIEGSAQADTILSNLLQDGEMQVFNSAAMETSGNPIGPGPDACAANG